MSPSREAASGSATQEFVNVTWKVKACRRAIKSLPQVLVLSQTTPDYSSPQHPALSLQEQSEQQ
jgi:hypothetical protein